MKLEESNLKMGAPNGVSSCNFFRRSQSSAPPIIALERAVKESENLVLAEECTTYVLVLTESCTLGVVHKMSRKLVIRLNIGGRPIA